MIILGIDPGLATVGIGILQFDGTIEVLDYCTIETSSVLSAPDRLKEIHDDLLGVISEYMPDRVVIEKLYFETNVKTAMSVAEARGVILLTAQESGLEIIEKTPMELKSIVTGDGHADKEQMKMMLERTLNIDLTGVRDDAVDALGLAFCGTLTENNKVLQ